MNGGDPRYNFKGFQTTEMFRILKEAEQSIPLSGSLDGSKPLFLRTKTNNYLIYDFDCTVCQTNEWLHYIIAWRIVATGSINSCDDFDSDCRPNDRIGTRKCVRKLLSSFLTHFSMASVRPQELQTITI